MNILINYEWPGYDNLSIAAEISLHHRKDQTVNCKQEQNCTPKLLNLYVQKKVSTQSTYSFRMLYPENNAVCSFSTSTKFPEWSHNDIIKDSWNELGPITLQFGLSEVSKK